MEVGGAPADWLNADTVDSCCQSLVNMCVKAGSPDAGSVIFVSSLAVTAAQGRLNTPGSSQESVRRALGIGNKTWPPRDMACLSINNGSHWSLLAYFPAHDPARIYHYDSGRDFPSGGNATYARKVVTMMACVRLVPRWVQLVEDKRFPAQEGGVECGYYLVAAMTNLLWHRRSRLKRRRPVTPMNFYNMDLLHAYGLPKLQEIVRTLLSGVEVSSQRQQQQQTIFRRRPRSASFDSDERQQQQQHHHYHHYYHHHHHYAPPSSPSFASDSERSPRRKSRHRTW